MSMQNSAVAGSRVTTLQRRPAKAYPVPIGDEAFRRFSPQEKRETAYQNVHVGPWGATPIEHAQSRAAMVLKRVDAIGLGLTWGAVFALWPFAFCFLVGLL